MSYLLLVSMKIRDSNWLYFAIHFVGNMFILWRLEYEICISWHCNIIFFDPSCLFTIFQTYALFLFVQITIWHRRKSYYQFDFTCQRRKYFEINVYTKHILLKQKKALVSFMYSFTKKSEKVTQIQNNFSNWIFWLCQMHPSFILLILFCMYYVEPIPI